MSSVSTPTPVPRPPAVTRSSEEEARPARRLKVLVLEGSRRIGGGQRVTLDMISALAERAEFALVVPGAGELEDAAESAGIRRRRISYPAPSGKFGVIDRLSYLPRGANALRPLLSLVREMAPDLIYATSRTAFLSSIAGRITDTSVAVHLHMVPATRKTAWFLQKVCSMDAVKKVLVASPVIAEHVSVPTGKLCVTPNGIDASRFQHGFETRAAVRSEFNLGEATNVAAVIGELSPEKGQLQAVRALAELRTRGIDSSLLIVGAARLANERYEAVLRDEADKLNHREHVHFTGRRYDVPRLLSAVDLLLAPSQGLSGEACPMSVLEAWAAGVPVLGAETGGLPEMLSNGRGALFSNDDPESLVAEWGALAASPGRLDAMSRAGLEAVYGEYSSRVAYDRIYEAIDAAVAG